MAATGTVLPSSTTEMTTLPANTTGCTLFNGQDHLCDIIIGVKRFIACISMIGCLFIIFIIWLFKKYQVFAQRLILYLSIGALLSSITYIMGDHYPAGSLCTFQAWALTLFDWAVLLWVCCITFNLYMNAVRSTRTDRFEWAYHLVSWGVPFIISILPLITKKYGPSGIWCWIIDDWKWRFGMWYLPLFLIITALFTTYIYIVVMVNRRAKTWEGLYDPDVERKKLLLKEDVKPLRGYPFIYLAVSVFPLINRIQNAVNPYPVFALVLLQAISSPLHGALNTVVFGLDKETRSRLTLAQMKVAFQSRGGPSEIHEYPVLYRSQSADSQELHMPNKFNNVTYSRLH